ncbi:MAG: formimidoyltetrahydrofolate cyclodeaminase [Actinophytocola sp.]|nr:formimidoyltetrahydrofolate cyclodeaminase [Actinophytocola sp.]
MREKTIDEFLTQLAARVPTPGGGATAALHAAQAAALIAMVGHYSTGEKYAAHADEIGRIVADADELRAEALLLAENDAAAFAAVADAFRLSKSTDDEKSARSAAIAAALVGACAPPAEVIEAAGRLIELAEGLLPVGNRNVISDVAAAAEAVRAAATTARVNIEINLGGITDEESRRELRMATGRVDAIAERAEKVTTAVRAEIRA